VPVLPPGLRPSTKSAVAGGVKRASSDFNGFAAQPSTKSAVAGGVKLLCSSPEIQPARAFNEVRRCWRSEARKRCRSEQGSFSFNEVRRCWRSEAVGQCIQGAHKGPSTKSAVAGGVKPEVFCEGIGRPAPSTKSAVAGGVKPYGARLLINLLKMIGVREILPGCLLVSNVHLASLAQAYVYQCDSACAKGPENALCSGFAGNIRPRPMWRWRPRYSGPSSGRRKRMRACQQ
jgi:hypothetical protein